MTLLSSLATIGLLCRMWGRRELQAFRNIFPHENNNTTRKLSLLSLLVVWVVIEIGSFLTGRTAPDSIELIRYVVIAILFREHGLEIGRQAFPPNKK